MILSGSAILKELSKGRINISPFDERHLTTNSCDLTLGNTFIRYTCDVLDTAAENAYETITVKDGPITLERGQFLLGHSVEVVGSDHFVPIIHARSGVARMGLFVHVTADLIDIGSHGNITLQLYSTLPVTIYPGMRIAQVSFWKTTGEITLYKGKYQGSKGPRVSQVHADFAHSDA